MERNREQNVKSHKSPVNGIALDFLTYKNLLIHILSIFAKSEFEEMWYTRYMN